MITERNFQTRVSVPTDARQRMIDLLNAQLADAFDLFSQAKQAHWNVKGAQFYQMHELFDELAAQLKDHVDLIAERATALGGMAMGTARMAAGRSRLPEWNTGVTESLAVADALAERFGALAATTRDAIAVADEHGDPATSDLLTEVLRSVEKGLWFLEAHPQR
jgi:starvation-inducible DNA-binding protein